MLVEKTAKRNDVNPKEGEHKYGNVDFADEKNKKYPIDTERHVRAALAYINMAKNEKEYSAADLQTIKDKIYAAAKKFGISVSTAKSYEYGVNLDIVKAEEDSDGNLYLIGEASGLEWDQQNEKMDIDALKSMSSDVTDGYVDYNGELKPVILRDTHRGEGVTKELGEITDCYIDKSTGHWVIKSILDKDNPDAVFVHKKIQKGKKYGFSVGGRALKLSSEYNPESQTRGVVYKDIAINHVALTTVPVWSPSLGSVIAKAFEEIDESEEKERKEIQTISIQKSMEKDDKEKELETSKSEVTPDKPDSNASSQPDLVAEGEGAEEKSEESAEKSMPDNDKDVEKAAEKVNADRLAHVSGRLGHAQTMLHAIGSGAANPDESLDYITEHLANTNKMLKNLKNGNTAMVDDSMKSKIPNPNQVWLSQENKEEESKGEKVEKAQEGEEVNKALETFVGQEVEKALLKVDGRIEKMMERVEKLESNPNNPVGFARPVLKGSNETLKGGNNEESIKELFKSYEEDLKTDMSPALFGNKWQNYMPVFKQHKFIK